MTPVADALNNQDQDDLRLSIYSKKAMDVVSALHADKPCLQDFMALVSPAAEPFLESMAQRAASLTRRHFGHTMQMFVPLYLSNLCANECTYCGFTMSNRIKRKVLSSDEIEAEAQAIRQMGFNSVLLVTGEHETKVGLEYLIAAVRLLKPHFSHLMLEVQPMSESDYAQLIKAGVDGVLVYQETYHRRTYADYHLRGSKQDFDWRLQTGDRLGRNGMAKIGVGALLGLSDWRVDSTMTALHARLLQQTYWRSRYSIAFPRLRPCAGSVHEQQQMLSDKQLVQLICAHRIMHPQVELSLSTRESPHFRDHVSQLGITSMSAASQTQPGGYASANGALEQFSTEDNRPASQVAAALLDRGIEPVWHDWLHGFSG